MTTKIKYTRQSALAELAKTREINTAMLSALGLSFEHFLRYAQISKENQQQFIDLLIKRG